MGLDIVELFMRIEDEFSIEISQEEAQALETVGQMRDFVMRKLHLDGRARVCASQWTFCRLRAALARTVGLDRASIRPDTSIAALLPATWRESEWDRVGDAAGLVIPHRLPPGDIARAHPVLAHVLSVGCASGCAFLLLAPLLAPLLALVASLILGPMLLLGMRAAGRTLDRRLPTMRELVHATVARNAHTVAAASGGISDRDVLSALVEILHDEVAVPREWIVPEAHFERDLKLG